MPPVSFPGTITIADTVEKGIEALRELEGTMVVGFDTETKPSFRKGQYNSVALIQVSTADHSYLFRVNKTGFFDEMKWFLEREDIKKIGLSLKDDFKVLGRRARFTPGGFIDLQSMVADYGIGDGSLQKIYAIIFGMRISKGQRLTNWEAPTLTLPQCNYASIDAWACLRIYDELLSGRFSAADARYGHLAEAEPSAKQ